MKVSVLIPTYNRAYILHHALESALRQTYKNFEIVVVDDGSTDGTGDLINRFASDRIRYIQHQKNRGYSAACNTAIQNAQGDLLGFLDSDDAWRPDYLESQVSFLSRHLEVGAAFTDLEITHGPRVIPSLTHRMKPFARLLESHPESDIVLTSRELYLCLLEDVPIKPTALVVRRELYDRAGLFNESWPSGTDWDLFLRFSHLTAFGYIDRPLAIQKWSPDATHRKYWEQDKKFLIGTFVKEKRRVADDKEARAAINRGLTVQFSHLAFHYMHTNRRKKAVASYLEGFLETGDHGLLVRAMAALPPLKWRNFVKKLIGRGSNREDLARGLTRG
jgi:glycosyltransferase involved in cell wall biosynthesis